ncbi:MAG TPA: hypothetical protein VEO96_08130 [Thermoplasmata archaeon]|nr:hypothetical protein [Thermoplasmata archaeon]
MHRWGYAPTVAALASDLLGGSTQPTHLLDAIGSSEHFILRDEFVCLPGHEALVERSRPRVRANRLLNGHAKEAALRFTADLLRVCPFIDCVALSGSVASGGYVPTDDIDLDIFVPDGAKYVTYAISLALSLGFSLEHRGRGRLRKIVCVNVIWTRTQTAPFARKDASLAFELLHCLPLVGAQSFREVIRRNRWIDGYFPQIATDRWTDLERPRPNLIGKLVAWVAAHPEAQVLAERIARAISYLVYVTVHWLRRHDRAAMERLDFLQRAKYPYEVFQD